MNTRLLLTTALVALVSVTGCPKGGVPGAGGLPGAPAGVPTSMPSGEVDPNTCGNYAAVDAGRKLKAFLQATKDLEATTVETVKVVKQSCVMMGQELGMSEADLQGETNDICAKVITTYQNNLKVSLKANAKLTIKYKPAVCKVDAQLSAKAAAECEGSATAGTGGSGGGGQCKAAAAVNASLNVQCTPAELTIEADAKVVLDDNAEVRGYIEQLIGLDLLRLNGDEYPVLGLTAKGIELLKNENSYPGLTLARQRAPRKDTLRPRSRVEAESWEGVDAGLFEKLRAVRLDIARSRGVPPYVIFHDVTLRDMARLRPTSFTSLLTVKGVGARKADDLGDLFLAAIRAHPS
jgi:hypothetical protein